MMQIKPKKLIKLLNNKVASIVKASSTGEPINDQVIDKIMIQNNVDDLTNKVKSMVVQGILAPQKQLVTICSLSGPNKMI